MQHPRRTTPTRTIAITGGKGGVGKTTIAVNLATALAARGRRTLLLDGDLGLANADIMLGVSPRYTLADVLGGRCTLESVTTATRFGFDLIPAATGIAQLAALPETAHASIVQACSTLQRAFDDLIIDTAPGLGPSVLQLSQAAQQIVVVVCDEPTSLTDAYALIKVLANERGVRRFRVLANRVHGTAVGGKLFATLNAVATRFLDVILEFAGEIPEDAQLRRAIRERHPVLAAFPESPAARALKDFARRADNWPVPAGPRGHIEFFAERLLPRPPIRLEVVR
ncbi:MAG: AAA family ATPase [Steroidobacteraceae bacterium]|nr:AAA family ATPase [Steroidobacteraceae bacterium]MDW8258057.1 AAA family ATPase [Gammaproteobacteria bacterium]